MKKLMVLLYAVLVMVSLQGCSGEARDDAKEAGSDMKREIKQAGHNAADMVEDAADNVKDAAHDATH